MSDDLGGGPYAIAFDGARLWTANNQGSVSIVTPAATTPWPSTTINGLQAPVGILFDGRHIWITDADAGTMVEFDGDGNVLQTIDLGGRPAGLAFDGTNIWVPNGFSNVVSVVNASTGTLVRTLSGNQMAGPFFAVFDGQRVLILDGLSGAEGVSLWRAADLYPLGFVGLDASPISACSDGGHVWITLNSGQLAMF